MPCGGRPALACGNVVVLVPHPDAPLGALVLAEAGAEAELPEGVLNVLPAGVLGGDVDAVAVTGPSAFCRDAARLAPGRPFRRRVTGGLVQVVHDDAPLDQAVDGIVEALGGDQRVLVAESVADELAELLRERLARLRVGDPLDHNTDLGPLASPQQRDRAVALATAADDEGARRWTGPAPLPERGWFLAPTVFTDVAPTMRIAREELAGPLLPVLTFRTPAEAVATAGAPRAAAVWTDKGSRALWTAQRLRAGRDVGERGGALGSRGPGRGPRRPPGVLGPIGPNRPRDHRRPDGGAQRGAVRHRQTDLADERRAGGRGEQRGVEHQLRAPEHLGVPAGPTPPHDR